jgi:hypothetical protein
MRAALLAELFAQPRRRVARGTALATGVLTVSLVVLRALTSSAETAAAVRTAEREAASLSAMFGEQTLPAHTYVEPRYMFAGQFPHDLAWFLVGCALLAFVGGALLVGGDWRTGAVGATFRRHFSRSRPALARLVVWAAWSMLVAVCAAVLVTGLLLAVASLRGSPSGADLVGAALMIARGGLVVLVGASSGAALGALSRSDVGVVVLLLVYVLVVETLMPVLVMGLRTPAAVVHAFIRSEDVGRDSAFVCDVPRCPEPVLAGAGSWAGYALMAGVLVLAALVTRAGARRAVWR